MGAVSVSYEAFLGNKTRADEQNGFEPIWIPDEMFDFQKRLTEWAIRTGRAALLEDCGLGKSFQELVWAENVVRHTNRPVLLATPIAVGAQMVSEGEKFGIATERSRDGKTSGIARVVITNYEQLHKFNPADFGGFVGDESSCVKNAKSATKAAVGEFCRLIKYRLLATATAAPNDYHELGTSSDVLGYLGYQDMLTKFFKQDTVKDYLGWGRAKYRFRGHSEHPFWQWVCSWARCIRRPSDIGGDDSRYVLPELRQHEHIVDTAKTRDGLLFALPAMNLHEQREERRNSIGERCDKAAEIATSHNGPCVLWCELNDEGNRLARDIPESVQLSGATSEDRKEEILIAFTRGEIKRLITKPKLGCWGLNWQHCHKTVMFPSHSFEQTYQAIRRFWRFGQKHPVDVDLVVNEGEIGVLRNLERKSKQADEMFAALVTYMNEAISVDRNDLFTNKETIPSWL